MPVTHIDEHQIREAAYYIWLDDGQPVGRDEEHWLKAIDALTPAKPKRKPARKSPAKAASKAAPKKAAAPAKAKRTTRTKAKSNAKSADA